MDRSVLDTDIFSEVLKRKNGNVVRRAEEYLRLHGRFTITCITVLEVVAGWHRLQREDRVNEFLARLPDLEVPDRAETRTLSARGTRLMPITPKFGETIRA